MRRELYIEAGARLSDAFRTVPLVGSFPARIRVVNDHRGLLQLLVYSWIIQGGDRWRSLTRI
jgi:hypothetical protein